MTPLMRHHGHCMPHSSNIVVFGHRKNGSPTSSSQISMSKILLGGCMTGTPKRRSYCESSFIRKVKLFHLVFIFESSKKVVFGHRKNGSPTSSSQIWMSKILLGGSRRSYCESIFIRKVKLFHLIFCALFCAPRLHMHVTGSGWLRRH